MPTEYATVQVTVRDTLGQPLGNQPVLITSLVFNVLKDTATANKPPFSLDSVPANGQFSFVVAPRTGTYATGVVTISVGSGTSRRRLDLTFTSTEAPVPPYVNEQIPNNITVVDSPVVVLTITADSARGATLGNAVVDLSSTFFTIMSSTPPATLLNKDTTGTDGRVTFRINSRVAGTGIVTVTVTTAAGMIRTVPLTITVSDQILQNRPRQMTFTVMRPILKADGSDSTELRVVVKDENNNPLSAETVTFKSTGGLVSAEATTDAWGRATGMLISERVNKSVVVTATLAKTGATAQQTVVFDGINIKIEASKKVVMHDSLVYLTFELRDANAVPMSGDTLEIVAIDADRGLGQRLPVGSTQTRDSMLVAVDARGQFKTYITAKREDSVIIEARALGARNVDTIIFTNNSLNLSASPTTITGNNRDVSTITAVLLNGALNPIQGYELRWTTTFGTFTTTPFTLTNASGQSSIVLKAPSGSGLAVVNVQAYDKVSGLVKASGNITVRVKPIAVRKLVLTVTPDNIPVRIGEAALMAQAYDSADNVMSDVLIGFRLVKGAGGGDEIILPPVSYTQAGFAQSVFKSGGVISLYQGVKLAAVALDIVGVDTLVVASSDTVGLTVSGPPARVSIGANILKGINPNDGTFSLPTAAVVTDVNGNLVADGTPVNFSVIPIEAHRNKLSWIPFSRVSDWNGCGDYIIDTVPVSGLERLPWTDYNSNSKLDNDEPVSPWNPTKPARGEDRDGDGIIRFGEPYVDINQNGLWDEFNAEPSFPCRRWIGTDSTNPNSWVDTIGFVDYDRSGTRTVMEPYVDVNRDGRCQCSGQMDSTGRLYEETYFGSPSTRPFPGFASVGIDRQKGTLVGKATTSITYVQSDAERITVRITAESNGIRNSVDVFLPVILGE